MKIINFDKKYSKQIVELWLSPEVTKNTLSTKEKITVKSINEKFRGNEHNVFIAIEDKKSNWLCVSKSRKISKESLCRFCYFC